MNLHKVDRRAGLYVMREGAGYSCYGFKVLDGKARAVAAWLNANPPTASIGTRAHFEQCAGLMARGAKHASETGTRCSADLAPQLIGLEGKRVEVVDRYGEKRRFRVGKSTGWLPCHLELHNSRSSGGCAVMGAPFKSIRVLN